MEYLVALAFAALVAVAWRGYATLEGAISLAAQERDALSALHAGQLAELCNRIQLPERAAHVSISNSAEPTPEVPPPDIEFEREALSA